MTAWIEICATDTPRFYNIICLDDFIQFTISSFTDDGQVEHGRILLLSVTEDENSASSLCVKFLHYLACLDH